MRARKTEAAPLTDNALTVLGARYLIHKRGRAARETPDQLWRRVARAVASVEAPKRRRSSEREFYELMSSLRFLPNSPTLMNAGKPGGQLSACFVLPIEDDLSSIFDTLKYAALIHQSGGGTGFSFSKLRPRGSSVRTTQGVATGPVSFIRLFDAATEIIKQGGTRRGANMAILDIDHPDIDEFIDCKRDGRSISNFNISVGMRSAWMRRALAGRGPEPARLDRICEAAWASGDPGLVFLDQIEKHNPTPELGPMLSTNPCGEQPLLPYESCNLGSINVARYLGSRAKGGASEFDWRGFERDIVTATRFLDNVIDANEFPLPQCEWITTRNRKIGLGIMGFADLLLALGVSYDSEAAREWGERLMSFLDQTAKRASAGLARERGAFKHWKGSRWQRLGYPKLRNATVSTIAPTGTISMIAGCSSGIEPIFGAVFYRNVLDGKRLLDVHPAVAQELAALGVASDEIARVAQSEELARRLPAWSPAQSLSVEAHVQMQARFQRHSDSAVSKTINLRAQASPSEVRRAYQLAYELGCKGITVYRDGSKSSQVLEAPPVPVVQPGRSGIVCEVC